MTGGRSTPTPSGCAGKSFPRCIRNGADDGAFNGFDGFLRLRAIGIKTSRLVHRDLFAQIVENRYEKTNY